MVYTTTQWRKGMHIHNVYFWLKDGLGETAEGEFEDGLALLTSDENVVSGYFGKPAGSDRDVVDSSYSYGLVLIFPDTAAHDRYQVGEAHLQFLEANMEKWTKVVVYDIVN
jgi:hypothetical protein